MCTHTYTHSYGLLQRQTLNMVTLNVVNVLYFIKTFLTQYSNSVMSENKGILGNSQLMMVWKLWTMTRVIWQAVAESCAPTR